MIKEQKDKTRKELKALRATIDAERKVAGEQSVCAALFSIIVGGVVDSHDAVDLHNVTDSCAAGQLPKRDQAGEAHCPKSGFIGLYEAFGNELSVDVLAEKLRKEGFRLAFPVAFEDGNMDFFSEEVDLGDHRNAECSQLAVEQNDGLVRFDFHTRLPAYKKHTRAQVDCLTLVDPEQISFVVVPGVGFDKQNYRLGYGAGYYDRYLPRLSPQTPLWGVAFDEQLLEQLPTQEHDVALTGVITPGVVDTKAVTL